MNVIVLQRRLLYICAIVLLLVPLYFLGNPSVRERDGNVQQPGGVLAQIRTSYDLGQGDLGEIDPASESMRLATLGLRGVASTILWQKAVDYKKKQNWDRFSATLKQIAVLQPHFIKVWEFQGHNMSYNVSSEFDDYRQRYQWVKRGFDYLIQGSKYNKKRTEMPFELGWFFGNKMGVADEREQFRELFRNDENYHTQVLESSTMDLRQPAGLGPDGKPDNWLAGTLWYQRAYDMVEANMRPARSQMMFYRMSPTWLMKYCEGIQAEGYFADAARNGWKRAERSWTDFGSRRIRTTFGDDIYLKELEKANQEYAKLKKEFENFCGDTFQKFLADAKAELTKVEVEAWETDQIERDFQQVMLAESVAQKLTIPPKAVAKQMPAEKRVEALKLADELQFAKDHIMHIEIYRNQINFAYWEARCIAEQEEEALLARTSMYEANELLEKGELDAAIEKYDVAWDSWNALFNKHPSMMIDDAANEVLKSIEDYRRLLDTNLPDEFVLRDFMKFRETYDSDMADPAMMGVIAAWPTKYPNRNFLKEMLSKTGALGDLQKSMQGATIDTTAKPTEEADVENRGTISITQPGGSAAPPIPDAPDEPDDNAPDTREPAQPVKAAVEESGGVSEPISVAKPTAAGAPVPEPEGTTSADAPAAQAAASDETSSSNAEGTANAGPTVSPAKPAAPPIPAKENSGDPSNAGK